MQNKITAFEIDSFEKEYLVKNLPTEFEVNYIEESITPDLAKQYNDSEYLIIFVYSQITPEIVDSMPNLKAIFTMSTGFDHIDVNYCKSKNISVHNVPFYGENTVAEHTFALILALSRRLYESLQRTANLDFTPDGLLGFDLKGKTLGIIGMGRIGYHTAKIAKGFDMKVQAFDAFPREDLAKELGFEYVSLDQLLGSSDIISLHTNYNPDTHHIINKDSIQKVKKGAYIINTARGGLIETDALIWALENDIIAGAGLDVLEEECYIKEEKILLSKSFKGNCDLHTVLQGHYLIKDPRVLVTPHNGFNSMEANVRILETTVHNIKKTLTGEESNLIKI